VTDLVPLAVEGTADGHWRLVNQAGEVVTAAGTGELESALANLVPVTGKTAPAKAKLALYVGEATVFRHRGAIAGLPREAELRLVTGDASLRLRRHGSGAAERLLVEVQRGLFVVAGDKAAFDEARWQLARPLGDIQPRLIALEGGGAAAIPVRPRIDKSTGRAVADVADPDRLAGILASLRGQTVLIIARVDGERLVIRPQRGGERSVLTKDLFAAAADGDAGLLVLQSSRPRQPSGRNWLWLKVEVAGLGRATETPTLGEMLVALAGKGEAVVVRIEPRDSERVRLTVQRIGDLGGASSRIGALLDDMATSITGSVSIDGIEGWLTSRSRRSELAWRLVPGVPSILQVGWLALVALGLLASPVARRWWGHVWPEEQRAEYAAAHGHAAARAMRAAAYLLLFLPLAAVPAALAGIGGLLARVVNRA
jgi:hypothetical protein